MGRKIFVSYKYGDTLVKNLHKRDLIWMGGQIQLVARTTRARDYVDELQKKIGEENINLGEKDGESLQDFEDSTIETALKRKIFRSSVTIVIISKGMKDVSKNEKDQWIPWELSYSLRTVQREDCSSQKNAVLGVVLPDETGLYEWFYTSNPDCNSITYQTGQLFKILRDNMFNILEKKYRECNGTKIHTTDEPSFIKTVKWDDFMFSDTYNFYINKAIEIKNNVEFYDVHINLD